MVRLCSKNRRSLLGSGYLDLEKNVSGFANRVAEEKRLCIDTLLSEGVSKERCAESILLALIDTSKLHSTLREKLLKARGIRNRGLSQIQSVGHQRHRCLHKRLHDLQLLA